MFAIQSRDCNKCKIKIDAHDCLLFAPKPCRAVKFVSCERKRDHSIQWKTRKATQNNPTNTNKKKVSQKCTCHFLSHYCTSSETARTRLLTHSPSVQEKKIFHCDSKHVPLGTHISRRPPQHNASPLKETSPGTILSTLNAESFCEDASPQIVKPLKTWQSKARHLSNDPH